MSLPMFAGVLEDILSSLYKDGVWKVDKILKLNLAFHLAN